MNTGLKYHDYSIQRVEVLKGPASLMYGSDALAGVINIISATAGCGWTYHRQYP